MIGISERILKHAKYRGGGYQLYSGQILWVSKRVSLWVLVIERSCESALQLCPGFSRREPLSPKYSLWTMAPVSPWTVLARVRLF